MKKRGLGKGIEEILGFDINQQALQNDNKGKYQLVALNKLVPNRYQPRTNFDETALQELANSIKANGLIQPIAVRKVSDANNKIQDSKYEIIAGERRFRAAKLANIGEVPVIIHDINDEETATFALIENLQREDLNAIEKAHGIKKLIDNFQLTHEQCGDILSMSRTSVTNYLRLIDLGEYAQQALHDKKIDMGHARALLAVDKNTQLELVKKIVLNGLSVRETEQLVKQSVIPNKTRASFTKSKTLNSLPTKLIKLTNSDVIIKVNERIDGSGKLVIHFKDENDITTFLNDIAKNYN